MLFVKESLDIREYFGEMSPHKIEKSFTRDAKHKRSVMYVLDMEAFSNKTIVIEESLDVGRFVDSYFFIE